MERASAPAVAPLDAHARIADDRAMKPFLVIASLALVAFAAPARADFASCVASLRSDASAKGVSDKTIAAAFDKLQPDAKVLDFETNQPEFKTPIWDYMAGLVDDERVDDGTGAVDGLARVGIEQNGPADVDVRHFAHGFQREIVSVDAQGVQEQFPVSGFEFFTFLARPL